MHVKKLSKQWFTGANFMNVYVYCKSSLYGFYLCSSGDSILRPAHVYNPVNFYVWITHEQSNWIEKDLYEFSAPWSFQLLWSVNLRGTWRRQVQTPSQRLALNPGPINGSPRLYYWAKRLKSCCKTVVLDHSPAPCSIFSWKNIRLLVCILKEDC